MGLSGTVRGELEAAKADLGAAEAPEGVDARTAARIERAIDESFVAAFRAAMLVSAGLALASALAAALLVGDRRAKSASRDPSVGGAPAAKCRYYAPRPEKRERRAGGALHNP
jgi:hypothetical protein